MELYSKVSSFLSSGWWYKIFGEEEKRLEVDMHNLPFFLLLLLLSVIMRSSNRVHAQNT